MTDRPAVYSQSQMLAHWLIAFLVLFQFLSGGFMEAAFAVSLRGEGPTVSGITFVHGGLGLAILGVMIWRLTMRRRHGTPPPPDTEPRPLQFVSRGVHYAFYVILIAMPLAGLAAVVTRSEAIADTHALASKLLLLLAALHVVGALWHLSKRDGVVHRMIRRDPPEVL